ncbi:MAG: ribose 5-phosphate isomerase B [Candidatus Marinimicrobia bacterium]|nr:ribose 5-phosphate isomerase B [Candidatus Neomarinimicrobiota bacterium]
MKIAIGSDHAAYPAKEQIVQYLTDLGFEVLDQGTDSQDSCDYPDYAALVSRSIQSGLVQKGVLICGSGIGMSIASNRFEGVRAALCYTEELAVLSRLHNDANVLCMGARTQSIDSMKSILKLWLDTAWEGERHAVRVGKIESNARGQHVK